MAIVTPTTPEVVRDIVDNADERELYIVSKEMEREPYWFAHEGMNARLGKALRRCLEGDIERLPNGDHVVKGSAGRLYVIKGRECECPASQKGKSSWCYHRVTVALYTEWQRRVHPATPADDRMARTMTALDTMNDAAAAVRLGQAAHDAQARALALSTMPDSTALQTHHTPQEDRMADDDTQYITEHEDAPTAVLDASNEDVPPMGQPTTRPLPGPVLLPSLDARTLEQSMQAYAAQRQVVTRYIKEQMTEGVDYYTLTIKGRVSKATLSKAGSEKFLSLFQLHAAFQQDEATWRMLGSKDGLLCYTCTLMTRSGEVIGEGRGARSVSQDGGDINKAIKMATKSAQVDAVLRTGALSDVFTQDISDHDEETPAHENAQEQRGRIWAIVKERAPEAKTREAVETWIKDKTGMDLHPDLYPAILARLRA